MLKLTFALLFAPLSCLTLPAQEAGAGTAAARSAKVIFPELLPTIALPFAFASSAHRGC